ncbi:MAG TPA: hypothetical protein PL064_04995 [Thermogutta sp.]|nr:hypothetical protein [Thermogutta sp.]HPU06061.1 hypothetical protein [Thermogutta sp.]HPZ82766.1 hypothetical protein [Thermogutta sp.]HQF12559.1 hypothetical protein [Thermogutta sp.]
MKRTYFARIVGVKLLWKKAIKTQRQEGRGRWSLRIASPARAVERP